MCHTAKREEVNTTNTRIKKLRKALDLTQAEFASRIGTSQNSLAGYETGRRNPSSSVVNNICKEFHVSETWLRTGEGEMFLEFSREDEIVAFVEATLRNESADFKRRLIAALSRLSPEGWEALEALVEDMTREREEEPPPWDQHAIWEAEARAEAEEVYRQILQEKTAEAGYSASPPGGGKLA